MSKVKGKSMKSREELTGLSSEQWKFSHVLLVLKNYIDEQEETENNLTDWQKTVRARQLEQHPNLVAKKGVINRHDLKLKIKEAILDYYRQFNIAKTKVDRLVFYDFTDALLAGKYLRQNPDSHITVNDNILPDNNTRYFLDSNLINEEFNRLCKIKNDFIINQLKQIEENKKIAQEKIIHSQDINPSLDNYHSIPICDTEANDSEPINNQRYGNRGLVSSS